MDMTKTGRFIAEKRKAMGYTQEQLGELLAVSGKAISKWERGISFPDISNISRLAVLLKTDVLSILEGGGIEIAESSSAVKTFAEIPFDDSIDADEVTLRMETTQTAVSPYLFGSNLEHTRSNIFRGLSAQMLKNRKFAGKPCAASGHAAEWYPIGSRAAFAFSAPYTRHMEGHYHMKRSHECNAQNIINFHPGYVSGLGQHEIYVQKEKGYECAAVLKADRPVEMKLALTSRHGKEIYAEETVLIEGTEWKRYSVNLCSGTEDADADLRLTFSDAANVHIGAVSLLPADHYRGMRRDVIENLKEMGLKLLRWPGGNFAGEYNWFDGLLPADMRAPFESYLGIETQPHSMGYDYHEINTDDFVALCREIGAQPYITINPAWNTPEESAAWVEYCNGGADTEYGKLRMERGFEDAYNVQFWSLGNEFGYGHMEGDNTPYGYQHIARQHGEAMKKVCDTISFCSSGPYPNSDWARHSAIPLSDLSSMVSLHYYAPERDFSDIEKDYHTCVNSVKIARSGIYNLRAQLNDNLRISFDEWNTWYAWYRPSCVTDGMFTGLMLHMIIGEAEKKGVAVACQFESINEGAIVVSPVGSQLTATGQAFSMMKHHIGGTICHSSDTALATVKDGVMTVSAVNASYDKPKRVKIPVGADSWTLKIFEGKELLPNSRFEIKEITIAGGNDGVEIEIPPHSMALLQAAVG